MPITGDSKVRREASTIGLSLRLPLITIGPRQGNKHLIGRKLGYVVLTQTSEDSEIHMAFNDSWVHQHGGTILLDATSEIIHEDVTFSRDDSAMVCDEEGNWRWEPVERTNLFLTSNSYNPSFSAGSGLTGEVVGTGMIGDLRYVDYRVSGTFSGGWTEWTIGAGILNMSDNVHTASVYAQILSGGTEPKIRFRPFFTKSSDSSRMWITSNVYLQTDATRHVWTSGEAVKQFNLLVACEAATGSSVDVTFRVWGLQVETGPTATTPIPTNGAPVIVPGPKHRLSYDVQTKEWGYLFEPQRTNLCIRGAFQAMAIESPEYAGHSQIYRRETTIRGLPAAVVMRDGSSNDAQYYQFWQKLDAGSYIVSWYQDRLTHPEGGDRTRVAVRRGGFFGETIQDGDPVVYKKDQYGVRASCTFTVPQGEVNAGVRVFAMESLPIGEEFVIGGFQIETGSIATSPIATNGVAKTVAADVCTYQNNVLTGAAGTVLARVYAPAYQGNRPVLSASVWDSNSYWLGYQFGPNPVARGGGSGPGAELFDTPDNSTLLMSYNGTTRTLVSGTQSEASGAGVATVPESPLYIGQDGKISGYINHLSVFPTQLNAIDRAEAVNLNFLTQ